MIEKDQLLISGDDRAVWQKYFGFLELSLEEFMNIQANLLREQIELVAETALGTKIMKGQKPTTVEEFRQQVPLTTYADYKEFLLNKTDDGLCEKAHIWVRTSGKTGEAKWVPKTKRAWERSVDYIIASMILSCATKRGDINLHAGDHILFNVAPRPYSSGFVAHSLAQRTGWLSIPPVEMFEKLSFQERIEFGFQMGLRNGVDVIASLASVLVKIGDSFADRSSSRKITISHPIVLLRLLRALLRSKMAKRAILPKDLWNIKGISSSGTDAAIYKDQIKYYWGVTPTEFYAATELGCLAMQTWNKKSMTFVPAACFLEFIEEDEWLKSRDNKEYVPKTILINQLKPGKIYELVATTFYGVPFLRYRIGDLLKVVSIRDEEANINLPQIMFHSRADDLIDLANFTRLDEKTIWEAINSANVKYEEWTIRKEYEEGDIILHLYMEVKDNHTSAEIRELVHHQLKLFSDDYKSMAEMLEINPIKVTLLPKGSFGQYIKMKQAAGADLGWLKPAHVNAPDHVINELLQIGQQEKSNK